MASRQLHGHPTVAPEGSKISVLTVLIPEAVRKFISTLPNSFKVAHDQGPGARGQGHAKKRGARQWGGGCAAVM